MPNRIVRSIPNTVTCLNLFSGCIACLMAFQADYKTAMFFILLSAVFDFFDGLLARILHAPSALGKELDSLADDISFGLAPSLIAFSLFKEVPYPAFLAGVKDIMPYTAFLIAVFSGLRLAKFNLDQRQTNSFIGLPVPANALFWGSLALGGRTFLLSEPFNAFWLLVLVIIFSFLLIAEIPMFSLKFKNLSWKDNHTSFIFLIVCIPLLICLGTGGLAAIIVWYILLSLVTGKKQ